MRHATGVVMQAGPSRESSQRRQRVGSLFLALTLWLTAGLGLPGFAQSNPYLRRKVVTYVKPLYPPMLKNMHIQGMVRLTAVVLPNGNVASVQVRGGNPILVENAVKAVKAWKYAPAATQTEEEVALDFGSK